MKVALVTLIAQLVFLASALLGVEVPRETVPKQVTIKVGRTTGEPFEAMSVIVWLPGNTLLGGGITNEQGEVTFANVPCPAAGDCTLKVQVSRSGPPWDELPEATKELYWHSAIRAPVFRTVGENENNVVKTIEFEPARVVTGSVQINGQSVSVNHLQYYIADPPSFASGETSVFKIPHVRFQPTTFFYGSIKRNAVPIPAGQSDVDLGVLTHTPEEATGQVAGEVDVDPSLMDTVEFGLESGITFVRLSDASVFTEYTLAESTGRGPNRRRVWPFGRPRGESPSLSLPPGQYVVVPGLFRARDFQVRAYERVAAGEVFQAPAKVFTVVAGERAEIGRIDYKQTIEYFLADPPPAPPVR